MDPNANLSELATLVTRGGLTADDHDRMRELAESLAEWITRGGFLPELTCDAESLALAMLCLRDDMWSIRPTVKAHCAAAGFAWLS